MARTDSANQRVVTHRTTHSGSWVIGRLIWWIAGVIDAILAFRFVLKLFGANPNADFTDFVYSISAPLATPFRAVFGTSRVQGSVFEWSTLLAIAVYALVAWGLVALIEGVAPRTARSVEAIDETKQHEQNPPA